MFIIFNYGFSTSVLRISELLELSELNTFKPLKKDYQIKGSRVPLWIGHCHLCIDYHLKLRL